MLALAGTGPLRVCGIGVETTGKPFSICGWVFKAGLAGAFKASMGELRARGGVCVGRREV